MTTYCNFTVGTYK